MANPIYSMSGLAPKNCSCGLGGVAFFLTSPLKKRHKSCVGVEALFFGQFTGDNSLPTRHFRVIRKRRADEKRFHRDGDHLGQYLQAGWDTKSLANSLGWCD